MTKDKLSQFYELEGFVLFGVGEASKPVASFLRKIGKQIVAYSDNNASTHGQVRNGCPVVAPRDIRTLLNGRTGVIIASSYQREIGAQLIEDGGIDQHLVFPYMTEMFVGEYGLRAYEETRQYLDGLLERLGDEESVRYVRSLVEFRRDLNPAALSRNPRVTGFYEYDVDPPMLRDSDVVIDCGAYIGDTAEVFLGRANVSKVYAVEGTSKNFDLLVDWAGKHGQGKVEPLKLFLGASKGEVNIFMSDGDDPSDPRASIYSNSSEAFETIAVDTVDALFHDAGKAPQVIKVDVEGADLDVLQGAVRTITAYRPRLMVAAYHKLAHLWEIPDFLRHLDVDYKIYAGHHPKCVHEIEYYVA